MGFADDVAAQEQEKMTSLQQAGTELRQRIQEICDKIDARTVEKGRLALRHAVSSRPTYSRDPADLFQELVAELETAHEQLFEAEIMAIEAKSDVGALMERNQSVKTMLEARRRAVDVLKREAEEEARAGRRLLQECEKILSDADTGEEQREFLTTLPETQTPEELEGEIESERTRLELVHEGNPNAVAEYEDRQKSIDKLRDRLAQTNSKLEDLNAAITEIRDKWEPELDRLVAKISAAFSENFEKIGCAGQVEVYKAEDFDQWAIQIQVKFRWAPPPHVCCHRSITTALTTEQRKRAPHDPRLAPSIRRRARRLDHLLSDGAAVALACPVPRGRRDQPRHGSTQRADRARTHG